MQLAIKATGEGAEMLSFLLSKNPQNLYDRTEKGHRVRLTYTVFSESEAEAVIFVTPDPIELVKNSPDTYEITQYINDREFAVSSIFCSYTRSALGTALNGRPKEEYLEWAKHPFQLTIGFGPVATDLPDGVIKQLFEPLGYQIKIERGEAAYNFKLKERSSARFIHLQAQLTVQNALQHLFVIIPVLDDYRHYFIDEREIEKLERYGEGWLNDHPLKELIIKRTLRFRELIDRVGFNLSPKAVYIENNNIANNNEVMMSGSMSSDKPVVRLNELRYQRIVKIVENLPIKESIVDFGAGEGKLSVLLGFIPGVKEILAVEPTEKEQLRALERFAEAGRKDGFISPTPVWGSLFYFDEQLSAKDIMILCEVIEHIDENRLPKVMDTIFSSYQPKVLLITTPNVEYNRVYQMDDEEIRHKDHRFEWTRAEFWQWSHTLADRYAYDVQIEGIGEEVEGYGHPSQLAIFTRQGGIGHE